VSAGFDTAEVGNPPKPLPVDEEVEEKEAEVGANWFPEKESDPYLAKRLR
jgi:hypothetical protein